MSWTAFDRAQSAVLALIEALDRDKMPDRRAEVATKLVLALPNWTQAANAARNDAFLALNEQGWSVDDIRERFGIERAKPLPPTWPRAAPRHASRDPA